MDHLKWMDGRADASGKWAVRGMQKKFRPPGGSVRRGDNKFGLSDVQWDEAVRELREAILAAARERRMTSYSEVAAQIKVTHVEPYSALMNHLLGAILESEHADGRPLLTSIVTHKDGDKEPGPGFYDMARTLGHRFSEPYIFWARQVQDVFTLHGQSKSRSTRRS